MTTMRAPVLSGRAFLSACILGFVLVCVATALAMIRVINWYLMNCETSTFACSAADTMISYWWLVFVPATLLAAAGLHEFYERRQRQKPQPGLTQ